MRCHRSLSARIHLSVFVQGILLCAMGVRGEPALPRNGPASVDLNLGPSFTYSTNSSDHPLFSPCYYGLVPGTESYAEFEALAGFAEEVITQFPPGIETFIAYCGNPYFSLTSWSPAAFTFAQESVGSAFLPSTGSSFVIPGRSVAFNFGSFGPTKFNLGGSNYEVSDIGSVSPLVLDFNGDGELAASGGLWQPHPARITGPYTVFDLDGDGFADICEWIGPGDALLTSSESPSDGRDLFGTANGWKDGYERLSAQFDWDGNGTVEGDEIAILCAWRDFNGNGIADPGEVALLTELGITALSITPTDGQATFTDSTGDHKMWDWWPNVAAANRRSATNAGGGRFLASQAPLLRPVAYGTNLTASPWPPLASSNLVTSAQLVAAGVNLDSFRLVQLVNHGRTLIGSDHSSGVPERARLIAMQLDPQGLVSSTKSVILPFDGLFQLATDPLGNTALVLGNRGSRLVMVDLVAGAVSPSNPILLGPKRLRGSGLAGYSGTFWFSAWQLDASGAVIDERLWALTPFGLEAGLSMDALRAEFGMFRMAEFTGPDRGFVVVPAAAGSGEELVYLNGLARTVLSKAAFGGIAAVGETAAFSAKEFLPAQTSASTYSVGTFSADGSVSEFPPSPDGSPAFYPLAAAGPGGSLTAIFTQLSASARRVTYRPAGGAGLFSTYPGQAKITPGAFAHYGIDGVTLIPLPDAPTPPSPVASYSMSNGSQIVQECLLCGIVTDPTPLSGHFGLRTIESNSLFSTYKVEDLVLQSSGTNGIQYLVTGDGYYQVSAGGTQEFVVSISVAHNGVQETAVLTNDDLAIQQPWPNIQSSLVQSNVVSGQQYHLKLFASLTSSTFTIRAENQGGNLRLDWTSGGSKFQVEQAAAVQGPYVAIGPVTTNLFFEAAGAFTNSPAAFYRLRQVQ